MTAATDPFFYTWTAQRAAKPVELTGGKGSHVFMKDGSTWLDLGALSYQANAGHGHPGITAAVVAQAQQVCLVPPSAEFPAKRALAEKLLTLAGPAYSKVFFALGGAEANENALKIARQFTRRHKFLSRYRSYHGATMGAATLTGDWRRAAVEPGIPGVIHVNDCSIDHCAHGHAPAACAAHCPAELEAIMGLEGGIAAAIFEPIPGANGVYIPHDTYWPAIARACAKHGALLIADEVLTGFGRTGEVFAHKRWGVTPDMITVAKALTGGYAPLSAVIVHERIAAHFNDAVLSCGLTNYAHPLGCAAGVAALEAYEREGLYDNARRLGPVLARELGALAARLEHRSIKVRSVGLMGCLEIAGDGAEWQLFSQRLVAQRIMLHADGKRQTAIITPPLCITETELVDGVKRVGEAAAVAFA